jgi:hypothetical protein
MEIAHEHKLSTKFKQSVTCMDLTTGRYAMNARSVGAFLMLMLVLVGLPAQNHIIFQLPLVNTTKEDVTKQGSTIGSSNSGHWEYVEYTTPPYTCSTRIHNASFIDIADCIHAKNYCPSNLMNWVYMDRNNTPYPRFNVSGFWTKMKNRRIIFIGSSLVCQQVLALVWTLGHGKVKWGKSLAKRCTTSRYCMLDSESNITICFRFMGSMATRIYHEGNFTFDHHLHGHGDSSCLLCDKILAKFDKFDMAFIQGSIAWYGGIPQLMSSSSSPYHWMQKILPIVYHNTMGMHY